ncbi:uncharacterized protein [Littorina saxatilis]|uniref:uncharacterized protein n=1 Tax=Littorina saxatilis TaxID=31220 RepID=UPI0038B51457
MMSFWGLTVLLSTFTLRATGAPTDGTRPGCETSPAVVGGTGSMTFHFRRGLDMSSDIFHAYVIRTGDTANVLQCDQRNEAGITCEIINQAFKTSSIVNHSLRLQAPHVTPDLAGNYTLWTTIGGAKELAVECRFVVRNEREGFPGDKRNLTIAGIGLGVAIGLILVFFVVICLARRRRNIYLN